MTVSAGRTVWAPAPRLGRTTLVPHPLWVPADHTPAMPASRSAGPHLLAAFAVAGYAALGIGAAVLAGMLGPDPLTGAALACAGVGLVLAGRVAPRVPFPPAAAAGIGLVLLVGVILHGALAQAAFDVRLLLLAVLGMALMLAAPFMRREVPLPRARMPVSSLAACAVALVGVPLVAWAFLAG
jgi:hypothetical protein